MDKIEKICQEIAQLKGVKLYTFSDILSEEPVADDLEEEVKNYFQGYWPGTETAEQCNTDLHFTPPAILRLARHFANWQKEQFEKNRLAHCDALSEEDCDRETDFAMEIIEKEHRHPTFIDAINYGMRLQKEQDTREMIMSDGSYFRRCYELGKRDMKEQMLKEAIPFYEVLKAVPPSPERDKVRIVVLKEED